MASNASAPFDHAKADIILRSSDNVDFRVFKLFLSLASPFFETLFDIPQPAEGHEAEETKDGLAVVPVTENSKTLGDLLRFCYPCTLAEDPKLDVLKDVVDILEAAQKYSLTAIEKKARQAISNPKILEAAPFQCFAIARRGGLREETLLAAKHTLSQPLIPPHFDGIELISASDLLALLHYHQGCGDAVYALMEGVSWIRPYNGKEFFGWLHGQNDGDRWKNSCKCSKSPRQYQVSMFNSITSPQWWESFREQTFWALRKNPCRGTLQACSEMTVQSVKTQGCPACSLNVTVGMRAFADIVERRIQEEVSKIKLRLEF